VKSEIARHSIIIRPIIIIIIIVIIKAISCSARSLNAANALQSQPHVT